MPARVHPTALIEEDVLLGDGTTVWDNVHIRHGTRIGAQCIIGEKTYIAYNVVIGNRVKINAFVYICNAVTIEDGVRSEERRVGKECRSRWSPYH